MAGWGCGLAMAIAKRKETLMHLFKSAVIDAPITAIWPVLRRFDGVVEWNPGVASAEIEGGKASDQVGCLRRLVLPDGGVIRETLLALNDRETSFTYDIVESPLPVWNYVATQRFQPVTMGEKTFTSWEVWFDVADENAQAMAELVGVGIFENGFAGMQKYFE